MSEGQVRPSLLCVAGSSFCALPIEHVVETTRPLPVEPLAGAPAFVSGYAIVRGAPVVVVATDLLLSGSRTPPTRLVILRSGRRKLGLLFAEVIGVRSLGANVFAGLPPLRDASAGAIAEIGALDGELVTLLDAARIVPEDVFAMLEALELAS